MSINPATWKSLKVFEPNGTVNRDQWNVFVNQLVTYLTGNSTAASLSSVLNGSKSITGSSLVIKDISLGSVSTNQTVDCTNSCWVSIDISIAAAFTLTLSNLMLGTPVFIRIANPTGGALTWKVLASQPGGTNYAAVFAKSSSTIVNLSVAGLSTGSGITNFLTGNSTPQNNLYLLVN